MNYLDIIQNATQASVHVMGEVRQATARYNSNTVCVTIGRTKSNAVLITDDTHNIDADPSELFKMILDKQMELLK